MKFTSSLVIAALLGNVTFDQINAIQMNQFAMVKEEPAAEATAPAAAEATTEAAANTTATANATAAGNATANATTTLT